MSSLSNPRLSNPNRTSEPQTIRDLIGKKFCLIVGLTCIAGFIIDLFVLATPLNPFTLEWRINVLQQMGDRSIVLFFGIALLLYSIFEQKAIKRPLSLVCLAIGVAFVLSCVLIVRDSIILQNQAIQTISTQEQQIQSQIEQAQSSPELSAQATPENLQVVSQQLGAQATTVKQSTRQSIAKAATASVGNFLVVGVGLIGLGRLGLKRVR